MINESVDTLGQWLRKQLVDPSLVSVIRKYLRSRGTRLMSHCVPRGSRYLSLARSQDLLGWDSFLAGRISTMFLDNRRDELSLLNRRGSSESWGVNFITELLKLTHAQWCLHNAVVHSPVSAGFTQRDHDRLVQRIKDLIFTDPSELLLNHRQLLETDVEALASGSIEEGGVWVEKMESAINATKVVRARMSIRPHGTWGDPSSSTHHCNRPTPNIYPNRHLTYSIVPTSVRPPRIGPVVHTDRSLRYRSRCKHK